MAELADAHDSGSCVRTNLQVHVGQPMQVQVLLSAPRQSKRYIAYSVFFASVLKTVSSSYHICAS